MPFSGSDAIIYDQDLQFQRPELLEFYTYWNNKRAGRPFPARMDIKPRDFVSILPWVHMYDVVDGGKEFSVRLAGTALADFFGKTDFRGKPISILPSPAAERLRKHLVTVLQRREPLRTYNARTSIPGQEFQASEGCYAPLSGNGNDINIIIAATLLEKAQIGRQTGLLAT